MVKDKILILDANQRSALAATRALGALGYQVFCADSLVQSLSGCSKFCHSHIQTPKITDPEKFINCLYNTSKRHKIDLILPMTDQSTPLVVKKRKEFSEIGVTIPTPDYKTISDVSDKAYLCDTAQKLGIPTPLSFTSQPGDAEEYGKKINYPAVIKPNKSKVLHDGRWLHGQVRIVHSLEEYLQVIRSNPIFQHYPFLIQEYIEGEGQGLFALYNKGGLSTYFAHQRLREKPPEGGVSVLCRSKTPSPMLLDYSKRLLDHFNWHGIAMVEYKVSTEGIPYLMEINTRFWGSLQLAIDSGVNFPALLCQTNLSTTEVKPEPYKVGLTLRWLLGDLDRLIITLKSSKPIRHKIKEIGRFFASFIKNRNVETFRINDPKPFFCELKQYFQSLLK